MVTLGFSTHNIMSSANGDSFTSLQIWIPFISFRCVIHVARTSNTMLNRSGKSVHPCLILDHTGKSFSFLLLNVMLTVGF